MSLAWEEEGKGSGERGKKERRWRGRERKRERKRRLTSSSHDAHAAGRVDDAGGNGDVAWLLHKCTRELLGSTVRGAEEQVSLGREGDGKGLQWTSWWQSWEERRCGRLWKESQRGLRVVKYKAKRKKGGKEGTGRSMNITLTIVHDLHRVVSQEEPLSCRLKL